MGKYRCKKCGKEFDFDWRKDKKTRKENPIPFFCSRACTNGRKHSLESKLKVSNTLRSNFAENNGYASYQDAKKKKCRMCGADINYVNNKYIYSCKDYNSCVYLRNGHKTLSKYFGFDSLSIGTEKIYPELFSIIYL